jgi:hypothetical protein
MQALEKAKNRFESKILKTKYCWIWQASKNDKGYGMFWLDGRYVRAHRFSYMIFRGSLDSKLVIDHLCKNTLCVNPQHLEQVTQAENVKRGLAGKINNSQARKIHCPKGHEYSRLDKNGHRLCGKCRSEQEMEYRKRKLDTNRQLGYN